jgi:hypothetical protein
MNDELTKKWAEAGRTGEPIPVGEIVVCDICDQDFTTRPDRGGFVFGSSAYCPYCAAERLQLIKDYREEHFIKDRANPGESFADFVRRFRGPDTTIQVQKFPK